MSANKSLNDMFREHYADAVSQALSQQNPILLELLILKDFHNFSHKKISQLYRDGYKTKHAIIKQLSSLEKKLYVRS